MMRKRVKVEDGWDCTWCGKHEAFGVWVAAHWRELLSHTCECGAEHDLKAGVIRRMKDGRTKKGGE